MDTNNSGKKRREITYRVGWKTGRIRWDETPKAGKATKTSLDAFSSKLFAFHTRYVWRSGLNISESLLLPLLYLLPALSFIGTVVLVYILTH
jgi:hypothetical protein